MHVIIGKMGMSLVPMAHEVSLPKDFMILCYVVLGPMRSYRLKNWVTTQWRGLRGLTTLHSSIQRLSRV